MCGIFTTLTDKTVSDVLSYFDLIQHRGPDSSKLEKIDTLGGKDLIFGFHRLAIVDPNERSMQPLILNDLVLICNGEIFNHSYLEKKYKFNTYSGSDCEVILHLYDYFGRGEYALKKTLDEIDAEFAFIIYDITNKVLIAARDPFGVRPLFYSYTGNDISIASEIKALGFCETVKPFVPGCYLFREQLDNFNKTSFVKYYFIKKNNSYKNYPEPEINIIHDNVRQILDTSVKKRLMSDRPVGCFLSGGVDSSLVTALVSNYLPNVECFSIGLNGGVDIEAAKKVVAHLNNNGHNLKHHIVNFTVEEGLQALRKVIWHLETYDITTIRASIPQYLLSKYIKENTDIIVLYSGEGQDELGSYSYFKMAPNASEFEAESERLIEELYMFDNLRVDRTTAAFGLEVRIPFLDTNYIEYMFTLNPELRMFKDCIEKKLLRDSFKDKNLLPPEILYRKKEAFSDAVSSNEVSWYKSLADHIETIVSDIELEEVRDIYKFNTPPSKEALYYRKIFNELFPNRERVIKHYWMPRWVECNGDPSATVLSCYKNEDIL